MSSEWLLAVYDPETARFNVHFFPNKESATERGKQLSEAFQRDCYVANVTQIFRFDRNMT
jgi:hypothetical protein